MGFYTNVNNKEGVKIQLGKDICQYLIDHSKDIFSVVGNILTPNPSLHNISAYATYILDSSNDSDNKSIFYNNNYWEIDDQYLVNFKFQLLFNKINEKPCFTLSPNCSIALKGCDEKMLDWLPENVFRLVLINTHRHDKTLGMENVKRCDQLAVIGDTHIKDFSGLENIKTSSFIIKNNTKLTTTKNSPEVGIKYDVTDDQSIRGIVDYENASVNISSCKELEEIDIHSSSNTKVNIFITEKTCPKISRVVSLPQEVGFIGCKNLSSDDFKDIKSNIDYIEVNDFKGKGSDMFSRHISSRDEVIEKLKKIVDDIKAKHWRFFDDLATVLTFYNLCEYAGISKSPYVEDGKIRCYSNLVDLGGRYNHEFSRDNIKKGVTRYLNQLGVKYKIISTDPHKSKDFEYIVIED